MVKIIVGVDGSAGARYALRWALERAHPNDEIEAVTVVPPLGGVVPGAPERRREFVQRAGRVLDEAVDAVVQEVGDRIPVLARTRQGSVAQTLVEESQDADHLVLGARGDGGFPAMLIGSVTHTCLLHAHCPVTVVPAPGTDPDA